MSPQTRQGLSGTKAAVGGHGVAHTVMAVAEEQLWFSSGERDGVEIAIFPISIAKPVGKTENRLCPPKGKELHQIPGPVPGGTGSLHWPRPR